MHFWIDKRATSFQYGRRRPTFYSSGTFASTAFGRERSIESLRPQSSNSSIARESQGASHNRLGSIGEELNIGVSPRHHNQPTLDQGRNERRGYVRTQYRRPSTYPPIPDPTVQEALDELQQELQATLASPSRHSDFTRRRSCFTTKHLGPTLCFMAFIVLCILVGKFVVEGPEFTESSRRPGSAHTNVPDQNRTFFFSFSELILVAFALVIFLTGVACLRKRTNELLLRQFRQHIMNSNTNGQSGEGGSSRSSGATLISVSDEEAGHPVESNSPGTVAIYSDVNLRTGRSERSHRHSLDVGTGQPGRSRRCYNYNYTCQQLVQKPPPYDVALHLPLPNESPPCHSKTRPTLSIHFTENSKEDNSEYEKENLESVNDNVSASSEKETPPPAYELQFSYEI